VEARRSPDLVEYVNPAVGRAGRRNPSLADLDRLAEILPPRRMIPWPYIAVEWIVD